MPLDTLNNYTPRKGPYGVSGNILTALSISPNDEEAWNKFPEEAKKEMLESLEKQDEFDLCSIDISNFCFQTVSIKRGDFPEFQDGVVQKDKIGNYIIIDGMKCREWQPGISGFTYENINDRNNAFNWLKIGFCLKGKYTKSIKTNYLGKLEPVKLPDDINEELGGPFYNIKFILTEGPLFGIKRNDIYEEISYKENLHEENPNNIQSYRDLLSRRLKTDEGGTLNINGEQFKPFKEGTSGLIYKEIKDKEGKKIFLARYKDGRMVGQGLILGRWGNTTYVATKKQN